MDNLIGSRIAGGNTEYSRKESDYYPTPPEATRALMKYLNLSEQCTVWEPACGEGHMADAIKGNGLLVIASDINDFGYGDPNKDFLTCEPPDKYDWIITNPPFSLAEAFIRRCKQLDKPFALLLKSQFWHAQKRHKLFYEVTPSDILPLTWRPDFLFKTRGGGSPLMNVIWCVWRGYGQTIYRPISKEEST